MYEVLTTSNNHSSICVSDDSEIASQNKNHRKYPHTSGLMLEPKPQVRMYTRYLKVIYMIDSKNTINVGVKC